jgi:hypothetical protein
MGIPDRDLSPRGPGMGKKCPPQAFVGIPARNFFRHGDRFGELKSDGNSPLPSLDGHMVSNPIDDGAGNRGRKGTGCPHGHGGWGSAG